MTATEDRWTVDEHGDLINTAGGSICTLIGESADLFRSALDNEYARRNLPDGVELHSDGTLWALGRNIASLPAGWQRRLNDGDWRELTDCVAFTNDWYEVRPPQEPPTVRVPWAESVGRIDPSDGIIEEVRRRRLTDGDLHAPEYRCGSSWFLADADGTVEVLA